jgi:small GTP-binding protein
VFKNLINRLFEKNYTDKSSILSSKDEELAYQDLESELNALKELLHATGTITKITESLNEIEGKMEVLTNKLGEIKNELVPSSLESTVRILRWDGKVIAQKGTVISKNKLILPIDTLTGEFALEIVITTKPQMDSKFRILWLGLDYAGKTTLLHKLRYNEFIKPTRTVGQELEDVILEGIKITNIDLGGQKALRQHWSQFPLRPNVIVYVIDILDNERFQEVYDAFQKHLVENERYDKIPVLILINKMDQYNSNQDPIATITEKVDLLSLLIDRTWQIKQVSALTGQGLDDALETLSKMIMDNETE